MRTTAIKHDLPHALLSHFIWFINEYSYYLKRLATLQEWLGRQLPNVLPYGGRTESIVLLEALGAELLREEEAEAKADGEGSTGAHHMVHRRVRNEDGAAGYAVVWKNGLSWSGIETHMGYN